MILLDQRFTYKGHMIHIHMEEDYNDRTTVKAYHKVQLPNGSTTMANISPYDTHRETVKLWIDLGMPYRSLNWNLEELKKKAREDENQQRASLAQTTKIGTSAGK